MNRGIKSAKPLDEWINNHVTNQSDYLRRHLIPADPELWKLENFLTFLEKRGEMIVNKLNNLFK